MGSFPVEEEKSEINKPSQDLSDVTYHGKTYNVTREGNAEILVLQTFEYSKGAKDGHPRPQSVFYNPIQQYNRDLSVLAIKAFGEDLAAIRKARYERRLEQLAKGGQQGKKRKRLQSKTKDGDEDTAFKDQRRDGDSPVNGASHKSSLKEASVSNTNNAPLPTTDAPSSKPGTLRDSPDLSKSIKQVENDTSEETMQTEPSGTGETAKSPSIASPFRILDALSATGLRAIRYAKEIPMATSITANDLSPSATASIALNIDHNKLAGKIVPNTSNAIDHMHQTAAASLPGCKHYHVIDLDPYGTAAPFLDSAVQAINDGGLLCVTCTDAGVFASLGYLEKTYSQYGGLPLKGAHAHEGGLRLILHAIATSAARYGMAIEPLLSLSIDFYARIFVRIHRSPAEVKFLASKTMVVYNCDAGCGAWSIQHLARAKEKKARNGDILYNFTSALAPAANIHCEHCGLKTHQAGPMWGGPLHNPHFIQRILDMLPTLDKKIYGTIPRIEGMLSVALHETIEDPPFALGSPDRPIPPMNPATRCYHPFFFNPSNLSRVLHCVSPSDAAVRGALMHLGYRTTRSHTKAGSICTDAPWSVVWEVMREWVRQKSPVKAEMFKKNTAGWGIMQKDRSRLNLVQAQQALRDAIDGPDLMDLKGLKEKVNAALCQLSQMTERTEGRASEVQDEGLALPQEVGTGGKYKSQYEFKNKAEKTSSEPHPSTLDIVFDENLGKEPQGKRMVKYQQNPRPDWGPMNRAKGDH
ncbi:tRNA (guanine26-N2/guanine27-N2)-dimethyltransferase, partial [Lecanoromycetidae sp. Uapishka_2]